MKKVTFFLLAVTFFMFVGLGKSETTLSANTDGHDVENREVYLNIMTTNKSQYHLVKKIVGEKHNVQYIISNEEQMNTFKPSEQIINNISNMDLFFYTGNGFEPWDTEFIDKLKKGKLGIINISRGIRSISIKNGENTIENPYYWLGIEEYKIGLYNVKTSIQDRDPKNRQFYEDNYNNAVKIIDENLKKYTDEINKLNEYKFIVIGDSFDYFFNGLGIKFIKASNNNIDSIIKENKLILESTIIIKDIEDSIDHKVPIKHIIGLQNFDGNKSFEELIFSNLELILSVNS